MVEGIANRSNGKYDFVSRSVDISDKVMGIVSDALKPEMKNISIKIFDDNNNELLNIRLDDECVVHDGSMLHFTIQNKKM